MNYGLLIEDKNDLKILNDNNIDYTFYDENEIDFETQKRIRKSHETVKSERGNILKWRTIIVILLIGIVMLIPQSTSKGVFDWSAEQFQMKMEAQVQERMEIDLRRDVEAMEHPIKDLDGSSF